MTDIGLPSPETDWETLLGNQFLLEHWAYVLRLDKTSAWLRREGTPNITCANDFSLLQAKAGLQAIKHGNTQAQEMRMDDGEQGELCLL